MAEKKTHTYGGEGEGDGIKRASRARCLVECIGRYGRGASHGMRAIRVFFGQKTQYSFSQYPRMHTPIESRVFEIVDFR